MLLDGVALSGLDWIDYFIRVTRIEGRGGAHSGDLGDQRIQVGRDL